MPGENLLLLYLVLVVGLGKVYGVNAPPSWSRDPDTKKINNMHSEHLSESKLIGTIVYTLKAIDPEGDPITYTVVDELDGAYFTVNSSTGEVMLDKSLDREVIDTLWITWDVSDDHGNSMISTVMVTVDDVNDVIPSFLGLPYSATLPEDLELGATVFTLVAQDNDLGDNAKIYYYFNQQYEKFSLSPESGAITLVQSLDYETTQLYQLELRAQNDPVDTQTDFSSSALLIIAIRDVQDTPPYFINLPYSTKIDENVAMGTSLIQVAAYDGDTDLNNQNDILYSLTENSSLFTIDEVTGLISTAAPINRESTTSSLTLAVQARENDTSQKPANVTVHALVSVQVMDVNDEVPSFGASHYNASLLENTQKNVAVGGLLLAVTDTDLEPFNLFSLSIVGEPASDIFEVYPSDEQMGITTATIRVKEPSALDFELLQSFSFKVCANETRTTELFSSCAEVKVELVDTNDNSPIFNSTAYTAWVDENAAGGTFVTTITASDQDSGVFGELSYGLEGSGKESFHIDGKGDVTVAPGAELDLETVSAYFLAVYVSDGDGRASSVQLSVHLRDVNDQPPEFQRDDYEAFVKEETVVDTPVVTVLATDRDTDYSNQHVTYTIVGGDPNGNFTINSTMGDIGLTGPIDFEKITNPEGKFVLLVQAADGGSPSLTALTQVSIFVEGLNDNSPFFNPMEYDAAISEEPMPEEIVVTVKAFDEDRASIDTYTYQSIFDLRIQEGAVDRFAIRTNYSTGTGEVYVANPDLDRDSHGDSYQLVIIAVDRGNQPNTGTCTVHIAVTDVNNKAPQFTQDSYDAVISEGLAVDSAVIQLSATDMDLDSQLQFAIDSLQAYSQEGQDITHLRDFGAVFAVDNATGSLHLQTAVDREEAAKFRLQLSVKDSAAPDPTQQTDTALLEVVVEDENDNTPQFVTLNNRGYYLGYFFEELSGAVSFYGGPVLATDPDLELNGEVTYQLIDNSGEDLTRFLAIDPATGSLEVVVAVDREEFEWLNITVLVSDKGSPFPLNTTAPIYIQVMDQNDNSPVFETDISYTAQVYENTSVGSEVLRVKAMDADSGNKAEIRYSIASGNSQGKFSIDGLTGAIVVVEELDREAIVSVDGTAQFSLTITAADESGGPTSKQTNQQVEIVVLDVNDQAPEFSASFYLVNLQEDDVLGKSIITLIASDGDQEGSPNTQLRYSIESGNQLGLFSINEETGLVVVAAATLQNKQGNYSLVVVARDGGSPQLQGHTTLIVHVADSNDAHPTFISMTLYDNRTVSLAQNNTNIILLPEDFVGPVCRILAEDTDLDANGEVRYQLEQALNSDYAAFSIDADTGWLQILETTDREAKASYTISIRAYDQGVPQLSQDTSLVVEVADADDNPPAFLGPFDDQGDLVPVELSVPEGAAGTLIGQVPAAVDSDLGDNAAIYYYLVCGNEAGRFWLGTADRQLGLLQPLDRELQDQHQLVVKAHPDPNYAAAGLTCPQPLPSSRRRRRDTSYSDLVSADRTLQLVLVSVLDLNDNPPAFSKAKYTAGFAVDTAEQFGALVTQVEAFDPDLGVNGEVEYSLVSQLGQVNGGKEKSVASFQISALTGEIFTNEVFSPDDTGNFTLTAQASDKDGLSNTTQVYIYLLTEGQRIEIHIRKDPNTVVTQQEELAGALSGALGLLCMVDIVQVHLDPANQPVPTETDAFLHCVHPDTGQVVEVQLILQRMEDNILEINAIFNTFNVISVQQAEWEAGGAGLSSGALSVTQWSLLGLLLAALLLALALAMLSGTLRRRYRRHLKAASLELKFYRGNINGGRDFDLPQPQPGTNFFNYERSNPVLGRSSSSITYSSTKDEAELNSLDENQVAGVGAGGSRKASTQSAESQEAFYTVAVSDLDLSSQDTASCKDDLFMLDTVLIQHSEEEGHPRPRHPPAAVAAMSNLDHLISRPDSPGQNSRGSGGPGDGGGDKMADKAAALERLEEELPALDSVSSGFGSGEVGVGPVAEGVVLEDLPPLDAAGPLERPLKAEADLYHDFDQIEAVGMQGGSPPPSLGVVPEEEGNGPAVGDHIRGVKFDPVEYII